MDERGGGGRPPRRKDAGPAIRNEDISPTRTLFVRNISFAVTEDELRELFSRYGEVRRIFNLIQKRGMAFITYYDIRAAEAAHRDTRDLNIKGRVAYVEYDARPESASQENNSGALYAQMKDLKGPLPTNQELAQHFEQFGHVTGIHDSAHPAERVVEFYDVRAADRAYEQTRRVPYLGAVLETFRAPARQKPPAPRARSRSPSPRRGNQASERRGSGGDSYRRHSPQRQHDTYSSSASASSYPSSSNFSSAPTPPPYATYGQPPQAVAPAQVSALLSLLTGVAQPLPQPQPPPTAQGLYKPAAVGVDASQSTALMGALLAQLARPAASTQPPLYTPAMAAPPPPAPAPIAKQDGNEVLAQLLRQLQGANR